MNKTGVDFLLTEYIDSIVVDKTIRGLLVNRNDIEKHLRDPTLYYVTNQFVDDYLEKCTIENSKLIAELCILFDIIINNTYKLLISPDDMNFQLFVLILNSKLVLDIEEKLEMIFVNKNDMPESEKKEKRAEITDLILAKMSDNLVKQLDVSEVNPDVYTFNVRLDLNKIIVSLLK